MPSFWLFGFPPRAPPTRARRAASSCSRRETSALLERLIGVVNTRRRKAASWLGVADRQRAGIDLPCPRVPGRGGPAARMVRRIPRWHVRVLQLGELIQAVIDRKIAVARLRILARGHRRTNRVTRARSGQPCPGSRKSSTGCPTSGTGPAVHRPPAIGRLMAASPRPAKPTGADILALIERYAAVGRLRGGGPGLGRPIHRDAHGRDTRSIASSTLGCGAGPAILARPTRHERRLPPTAVALVPAHVDLVARLQRDFPDRADEDQPKLTNLESCSLAY